MKVIIVGADAIGAHLAALFSKIKQDVIIIDEDESKLERISSDCDLLTIKSSSNTPIQSFRDAGVKNSDLFISVTRDENLNISLCVLAKSMGAKRTIARVENSEFTDEQITAAFERAGISSIIYPDDLAAQDILAGLELSWVSQRWDVHDGALTMLGVKLKAPFEIINRIMIMMSMGNQYSICPDLFHRVSRFCIIRIRYNPHPALCFHQKFRVSDMPDNHGLFSSSKKVKGRSGNAPLCRRTAAHSRCRLAHTRSYDSRLSSPDFISIRFSRSPFIFCFSG